MNWYFCWIWSAPLSNCVTSFEVEKKPSVAEVEMRQVSILLKMLKHFRIQDLKDDKDKINYFHVMIWR